MSNYNGAPQPPQNFPPPGYPSPGLPGRPPEQANRKALFIVLGSVAVFVVLVLVAVFVWVVPALTKAGTTVQPTAVANQTASGAPSADTATEAAPTAEATPADGGASADAGMPADAIALPAGWDALAGPTNIPADGDPLFSKFVTGESSFQYLKSWDNDRTFGITKDPETGEEMQQVAQGTPDLDADGISTAFAFFAETNQGKFGSDPAKVKAAIKATQDKLTKASTTELTQQLVGNKCASDFTSSTPETREFRRGLAVVVQFSCKTAAGEAIQAVNLFSITPWGTPQMMGVSGHKSYWDAHPGTFEKIANSYRINKWKQQ
ncbi:hypothetical protein [Arthrobacter alpinus]|nr:hypothetical protein [Arthrobacter alpinus]